MKEPDELPVKEEGSKVENPKTDVQEPVPDGTENPISTDVPSTETQPEKPGPSIETDAPVAEEPAQVPTLMLSIDGTPVTVLWEDNETVSELFTAVQNGAIEVSASRYGGFEQVGSLPQSFSRNDVRTTTQPGDIVLYSGNQLVIFFGSNSWSYTQLGHIEALSTDELTALLDKDIEVIEIKTAKITIDHKGLGLSQNEKMRVSADRSGRAFFRCGATPDLLAALQGNPGQPTPFFASVATLAVLALPLIIL